MDATITLKTYLEKNKTFVIPDYQRGYVWGKNYKDKKNSVDKLLDDLLERYHNHTEVFLQGVTVSEKKGEIVLIDGQQRTTCLYLLLKWLGYEGKFKIRYDVRKASNKYLLTLDPYNVKENSGEKYQDIFFFERTLCIIRDKLEKVDKKDFIDFLLTKVKFLYINVDPDKATQVFTMMNGNKAKMQEEEIIKAEILRLATLNETDREDFEIEWENNLLRSRYAKQWDNWLRWWNDEAVKSLFRCSNNMGLLVSSFLHIRKDTKLTFENFKSQYLSHNEPIEAKRTFDGLRRLQKRFEDAYNNPVIHNMVGAVLRIFDNNNQAKFIQYYFAEDNRTGLEEYYKLVFLGMTHDEIIGKNKEQFASKYNGTLNAVNDNYIYFNNPEIAYRLLLRFNIDQDNLQRRFFNFEIWNNRSLEHIQPKSKVGHITEEGTLLDGNDKPHESNDFDMMREEIKIIKGNEVVKTTEHSIGNLVLLYKDENSHFKDWDFARKKLEFFSPLKKELLKSRHLLHTIFVFAEKEKWDGPSIAQNKINVITQFKKDYKKIRLEFDYEE